MENSKIELVDAETVNCPFAPEFVPLLVPITLMETPGIPALSSLPMTTPVIERSWAWTPTKANWHKVKMNQKLLLRVILDPCFCKFFVINVLVY